MARIAGIELPKDKKVIAALPIIYGIGWALSKKILDQTKVDADKRVKDLSEEEISSLSKAVALFPIEGELRRVVQQNIIRLEQIGSYRGLRHKRRLPARGQRTRSNARTKRGKRVTIGALKKENLAKTASAPQAKGGAAPTKEQVRK